MPAVNSSIYAAAPKRAPIDADAGVFNSAPRSGGPTSPGYGASSAMSSTEYQGAVGAAMANRAQYLKGNNLTQYAANDPRVTNPNNMPTGVVNGNQVYDTKPTVYATGNGLTYFNPTSTPTRINASTTGDNFVLGANLNGGGGGGGGGGGAGAGVRGNSGSSGGLPGYNFGSGIGASGQIGTNAQNDQNEANAANNARYNQALGVNAVGQQSQQGALDANYGNIYSTINANRDAELGLLSTAGTTAHALQDRSLATAQGKTASGLAGRGLYNSTILDSQQRGNATDSALIQNQITEAANQQALGVYQQTGAQMVGAQGDYAHAETQAQQYGQGQQIGIIGERTDAGPPISQLASLLSQPGAMTGAAQQATGSTDPSIIQQWIQAQLAKLYGTSGAGAQNPYVDPRTIQNNQNAGYGSGAVVPPTNLAGTVGGNAGGIYNAGHADPNAPPISPAGDGDMNLRPNPATGAMEYWDPQYQQWLPQG